MEIDIKKAINTAYDLHNGQFRKVDGAPYIVHPLEVFSIVSRFTSKKEILTASLLHDSLEDTNYTETQMLNDFGEKVVEIVKLLSENKSLSWTERKKTYILNLRSSGNRGAILISAADKINNLQSILDTYEYEGPNIWKKFNAPKDAQYKFYRDYYFSLEDYMSIEIKNKLVDLISRLHKIAIMV